MTMEELKAAYKWGKETIAEFHQRGEKVPNFVYERMMELAELMIEMYELHD